MSVIGNHVILAATQHFDAFGPKPTSNRICGSPTSPSKSSSRQFVDLLRVQTSTAQQRGGDQADASLR